MPTVSSSLKHGDSNYLPSIQLTVAEEAETLHSLDPNKACGPDGIPSRLLTKVADEIAPSLCKLFNISLSLGIMPREGGGVLPNMSYIGMCRCEGYGFQRVYSRIGYRN